MFELVRAGGWLMVPIIFSSIIAIAIIIERFWTLNPKRIAPRSMLAEVWGKIKQNQLDAVQLRELRMSSPLGQILAAGLVSSKSGRVVMTESIEQAASHVVHDMERYLSTLGTIAAVTPLIGLLGTVMGMIKVFSEIMIEGTGNANAMAGGISEALITTAAGLCVAIPALMFYRMLNRRIETLVVELERESIKLVDALHTSRTVDYQDGDSSLQKPGEASLPKTGEASLPKTGEASLPKAGEASLPKAGEASLPKTGEASLPKAGEASLPKTGEASSEKPGKASSEKLGEASSEKDSENIEA